MYSLILIYKIQNIDLLNGFKMVFMLINESYCKALPQTTVLISHSVGHLQFLFHSSILTDLDKRKPNVYLTFYKFK